MRQKFFICAILLALSSTVGCHRGPVAHYVRAYNKTELDELIKSGMTEVQVTNTFGPATPEMRDVEGSNVIITYLFFPEQIKHDSKVHLVGFSVDIDNGRVTSWSGIDGESFSTFQTVTSSQAATSLGEMRFEIFIETDSLTNTLDMLDSNGRADVSDLKLAPDVVFEAQAFAHRDEKASSTNAILFLVLSDNDVPKLRELSENNLGKRMLIVCRNEAIASPRILMPLTSNKIEFSVSDLELLSRLK
jgi:hypothetical protein